MIRYPAVAGYFYPIEKDKLIQLIDSLLRMAKPKENGHLVGAVVPHAGYVYSGLTAAHVYKLLMKQEPKTTVIVGPNHTGYGVPLSVFPRGEWVTPLGYVKVNDKVAEKIVNSSKYATFDVEAHIEEHSIEVQLPFLQFIWDDRFDFVPITMMIQDIDYAEDLAQAVPENVLFLASSDFSHYVPAEVGKEMDMKLIEAILDMDEKRFLRLIHETGATPCGYGPITSLIIWAKEVGATPELLHFSNSGDTSGDYSSVVDYAAIGFFI